MKKAALAIALLAALAFPGAAAADELPLGRHVSDCARTHLPPVQPPAVVCDGHAFAHFGELVRHMLERHG